MVRHTFGGALPDWTFSEGAGGAAILNPSVTVTFWNAVTGGTQYTDLLLNSVPVTSVTSGNGTTTIKGQIPEFQGPDNVNFMYAQGGASGPRALITPSKPVQAYTTIQDEGTNLNARRTLNFTGAGVAVTDDTLNQRTNVSITGASVDVFRPSFLMVASNDAPSYIKDGADHVCDGTADQTEINAAMTKARALNSLGGPVGGESISLVKLSGGRFNLSGSVLVGNATWLQGQGKLTELRAVSLAGVTGAGSALGMIKKVAPGDHLIQVSDMNLLLNYASGGTCHGVYFDGTGGTGTGEYPTSSPDNYHQLFNLYVIGGTNTPSTRHGIYINSSSPSKERSGFIHNCFVRDVTGDGVRLENGSDWAITNVTVGGAITSGFHISGGNPKLAECKSFFCDTNGFLFQSGRGTVSGCESQDDAIGFNFSGSPYVASGITADTNLNAGVRIGNAQVVITGMAIYNRSGGRYDPQTRGLWFDGTFTDCTVIGQVDDPRITTEIVGSPGARSFMRVSDGSSLVSVG